MAKGSSSDCELKGQLQLEQAPHRVSSGLKNTAKGGAKMFGKPASLTSGTEWLNDADAALVVTERVAIETGAVNLARRGTALGTRRALDNMASSKCLCSIERKEDVGREMVIIWLEELEKSRCWALSLLVGQI